LACEDLTLRQGLRKANRRFERIHDLLVRVYVSAAGYNDTRRMGAVLGLMAQMCADSALRDKLIDAGIVQRAIALLQYDATQRIALSALAMVTQYKVSTTTAHTIASLSGQLARLALYKCEDLILVELVVIVLSQALRITFLPRPPLVSFGERLELPTVVEAIYSILRNSRISYSILTHTIDLFAALTLYRPSPGEELLSLVPFLAAIARCDNIRTRAIAISGIMRLPATDDHECPSSFSPIRLGEMINEGLPEHLARPLEEFGEERVEMLVIFDASSKYRHLMGEAERRRESDLCTLGRTLAELVQVHDFAIGDKLVDNPPAHYPPSTSPFTSWIDCLHFCSDALRSTPNPPVADLDAADILEMRFLHYRGDVERSFPIARSAIARSPDLAYAYFILGMQGDREEGLRWARRGLLCPEMTPFVRTQLLYRTAIHAAHMGFGLLQSPSPNWIERGIALIEAALDDTETFLREASPDNLWRLLMLDWKVILTILVRGPALSPELSELEPSKIMCGLSMQYSDFIGWHIAPDQLNRARELLLFHYFPAYQEWHGITQRYDEFNRSLRTHGTHTHLHDLWFTQIGSCNIEYVPQRDNHDFRLHRNETYKCSWCNKPSAVLKKCKRCGHTVYCNSTCQRAHWDAHKLVCVRA
ncbi:hypothetical protein OH76DRAFT_1361375, partial [Lentinus brumalis]